MNLTTQQLQYLIEIERTRSVSKAAANLYMGQPNLSRILRDTEAALGFDIFERTRKGVRPTEKGEQFLQHARNMLREADFIESLGPNSAQSNRFRICLPRSYTTLESVNQFLSSLGAAYKLDAVIRECHPRQALEIVDSGSAEIAVIRYGVGYQDYFSEQSQQRELTLQLLSQVEYQITVCAGHRLAGKSNVSNADLEPCTEILHRDTFFPANKADPEHYRVYTVDRMAQIQLLHSLPDAYLWSEPLPSIMLQAYKLIQLPCQNGGTVYQNALIYKPQCAMSDAEKRFLAWIKERGYLT